MAATFNAAILLALSDDTAAAVGAGLEENCRWRQVGSQGLFWVWRFWPRRSCRPHYFFPVLFVARGEKARDCGGRWYFQSLPRRGMLLMWLRHGHAFWDVYFWQQQVGRFNSATLQHGEPFWFYLAVLPLGLFPWTPLFALLFRRSGLTLTTSG